MSSGQLELRLLSFVTLSLVAFGLVMVYSATSAAAAVGGDDPMTYLKKQGAYALAGFVLLILASRFDYHRLRLLAPGLVLAALALCALVLVAGPAINGARRWFLLGPVSFQPSELAKLALAVWAAAWLARRPAPRTLAELWRPLGLLTAVFVGLLLLEPDLGTSITIVVMLGALLLVSGVPLPTLGGAGILVGAAGLVAIASSDYRRERFLAFLDPWAKPQDDGYQSVQAIIGMASGGVLGNGLGEGIQKVNYLPEAHTDMIFAIVGEELGLIGTTAVIMAFAVFGYAGFRVALRCRDPFGKRLAAALTALVCGQAAVNLAAVLGLAPLTGVPLPFVSYGGSSLVVLLTSVGVVLNIAANERVERARVPDRSRRNSRTRAAGARGRGGAAGARRAGDVRRVARPHRV